MKLIHLLICVSVVLLCSCQVKENKDKNVSADSVTSVKLPTDTNMVTAAIDSSHTAQNSIDWKGTYKGVLPCKGCAGVETEIMLHDGNTYMISTKTIGQPSTKTVLDHGDFVWSNGSVIELKGLAGGPVKYLVEEGHIVKLDEGGKKMDGGDSSKYILTKN